MLSTSLHPTNLKPSDTWVWTGTEGVSRHVKLRSLWSQGYASQPWGRTPQAVWKLDERLKDTHSEGESTMSSLKSYSLCLSSCLCATYCSVQAHGIKHNELQAPCGVGTCWQTCCALYAVVGEGGIGNSSHAVGFITAFSATESGSLTFSFTKTMWGSGSGFCKTSFLPFE